MVWRTILCSWCALAATASCGDSPGDPAEAGGSGGRAPSSAGTSAGGSGDAGGDSASAGDGAVSGDPGGGPGNAGGAGGAPECGSTSLALEPQHAEVLLVLDRSASMQEPADDVNATPTRWDVVVPSLVQAITDTDTRIDWGMKTFPEGDALACAAGAVTERVDVPIARGNAAVVNDAIAATTPAGNGTPTGDAIYAALLALQLSTSTNPKYLVLVTDGVPSCPEGLDQAETFALQAVTDAAASGYPTFVIGVSTTSPSAIETLNVLAVAGGVPLPNPNPLATRFYSAESQAELVSALGAIAGDLRSCIFELDAPPTFSDLVHVEIDGVVVPRDSAGADGWDFTDGTSSAIELHGPACDGVQAATDVRVVYDCPDLP